MDLSVVVTTFNRKELLMKCLDALERQNLPGYRYEIIVIDDGSSDGTEDLVRSHDHTDSVPIVYHRQENSGPAAARNAGIKRSQSSYVAFTDDDCIPALDWLHNLFGDLPSDRLCAGIGGRVVRIRDSLIGRYIDHVGAMQPPRKRDTAEVGYLVTANALYRKNPLVEVGGFNEKITWPGGEDPDLSYRLIEAGYHLAATDNAVVLHHHRDTISGLYRTFWFYGRGLAARQQNIREPIDLPTRYGLLKKTTRQSLRYLTEYSTLSVKDRVGFAGLCWIQALAFQAGCMSLQAPDLSIPRTSKGGEDYHSIAGRHPEARPDAHDR